MTPTDGDLLHRISERDDKAFSQLFLRYSNMVYRYAYSLTLNSNETDDLFQETWLRVVKYGDKIRDVNNFKSWIFSIIINLHRDQLRKKRTRRLYFSQRKLESDVMGESADCTLGSVIPTVDDNSKNVEINLMVKDALATLPLKQRQVFILKEMEGFKLAEIGSIMHIPLGTVKSLLHRAFKKLRNQLIDFQV